MSGIPDLTGVLLGTGPATTTSATSTSGLNTNTGTWMTDGTVPKDSGFDGFMQQVAYNGYKNGVDQWVKQLGGDPNDPTTFDTKRIPLTSDGKSIDYSKVDMGGQGHTLAAYTQELGEGNQGKTLYSMYQKGLTADDVSSAYANQGAVQDAITSLNSGGQVTPDIQKLIDSGQIKQSSSMGVDPNNPEQAKETTSWVGGGPGVSQPLFSHSSQTGADTGAFVFDKNSGFRTSPQNFHRGGWDMVSNMLPTLIMGGLFAGAGLAIGAVGAAGTTAADAGMAASDLGASEAAGVSGAPAGASVGAIEGGSFLSPGTLLKVPQYVNSASGLLNKPTIPASSNSSAESNAASTTTNTSTPRIPDLTGNILGTQSEPASSSNSGIVNSAMGS